MILTKPLPNHGKLVVMLIKITPGFIIDGTFERTQSFKLSSIHEFKGLLDSYSMPPVTVNTHLENLKTTFSGVVNLKRCYGTFVLLYDVLLK